MNLNYVKTVFSKLLKLFEIMSVNYLKNSLLMMYIYCIIVCLRS